MNAITTEIFTAILGTEEAWDKRTRKLRYGHVLKMYQDIHEQRFINEVMFPEWRKATKLLRALIPEDQRDVHFTPDETFGWLIQMCSEDCYFERFSDYLGVLVDRRCLFIFNEEKWAPEDPSEEEILALGIRPGIVPTKEFPDGSVQVTLF